MGVMKMFEEDLRVNENPSVLRKRYWVLLLIRRQNACKSAFMRKFFALLKRMVLAGTGCELPACAFRGGGGSV